MQILTTFIIVSKVKFGREAFGDAWGASNLTRFVQKLKIEVQRTSQWFNHHSCQLSVDDLFLKLLNNIRQIQSTNRNPTSRQLSVNTPTSQNGFI
jgi:hypothetical protein